MFIGHFALGYAAKRWAPRLSLAVLFAAALFADLLWPVLVALGIEHVRIVPGITASTPLEIHQLSVLAFAADADAHGRALRLAHRLRRTCRTRRGSSARTHRTQSHLSHPASSCSCW